MVITIQEKIKQAYSNATEYIQVANKEAFNPPEADSSNEMLQSEQEFHSILSTIVWFLEHDPYTNIAMNLDVNFRKVKQGNFKSKKEMGKDFMETVMQENGNTFQNSPIHLLFYEKNALENAPKSNDMILEVSPKLSSMSLCKLKKDKQFDFLSLVTGLELRLILSDVTAKFVSLEQYKQLLFVLGQKPQSACNQSCKDVLTLFNEFSTNTVFNFKYMLDKLQFPFCYDDNKRLNENRRNFQDFFSCLTNIRCAVVEGGHRCEAASRILQGYKFCEHIPLNQNGYNVVPESSTLFGKVPTVLYYCQDKDKLLNNQVLEYLKEKSEEIDCLKRLIVQPTWHDFLIQVSENISENINLEFDLYKSASDFFLENVKYRQMSVDTVPSNKIKKHLHEILTHAIFNYRPCSDLLNVIDKNFRPKPEDWGKDTNLWVSLSAEPFQQVSKFCSIICNN